jgi:hypothetical protein
LHWKTGFEANNKEAWTDASSNHPVSSTKNLWLLRTACNAITRRKNTDVDVQDQNTTGTDASSKSTTLSRLLED